MLEHFFDCPHCGADISMLIDCSVANQEYIEDCEVCCRPIEVMYGIRDQELMQFEAIALEQ
ncbi:MAG: CPXCG motif-containing cysteine-rich protein [Bacteroidota bacterium]